MAQTFAATVLKIIVPAPPGGSMDHTARLLAPALARHLGQPVVVENRPGGQAIVATESVVRAAPDGQTLLLVASSTAVNPGLHKLNYDTQSDLTPVAGIVRERYMLVARKELGATQLDALLARLQATGTRLSCGASPGVMLVACEQLRLAARAELVTVPFNGGAQLGNAIAAGHVDIAFLPLTSAARQVEAGRVHALAFGDSTRAAQPIPALPVLADRLPGFVVTGFLGLMAPVKTSPERVERLAWAVRTAQLDPEFRDAMERQGSPPMIMGPQAFGDFLQAETARYSRIIRDTGIRAP